MKINFFKKINIYQLLEAVGRCWKSQRLVGSTICWTGTFGGCPAREKNANHLGACRSCKELTYK